MSIERPCREDTKGINRQVMTILSVRLMSIERPRREDTKGMTNVHTNTPAKLRLNTIASEVEDAYTDM